jgi:DNA-binding IclR family transcriptional regulator
VRLPGRLTNPEVAKMIGTTRERVSHFLNAFQQCGWIRRDRGLWIHREGLRQSLGSEGSR